MPKIDYDENIEWEVCLLVCSNGHEKKMSIMKDCEIRNTFCIGCNRPVYFKRK